MPNWNNKQKKLVEEMGIIIDNNRMLLQRKTTPNFLFDFNKELFGHHNENIQIYEGGHSNEYAGRALWIGKNMNSELIQLPTGSYILTFSKK